MNSSGYSLIEVIIVITIIVLFTGMGIAGYTRFNDQRIVDAESKKILNLLETARSKAMTKDIDSQDVSACDFEGYRVIINTTAMARTYSLLIKCNGTTSLARTISMSESLTVSTTPQNPLSIDFAVATGSVPNCETDCMISINNTNIGRCKLITVKGSGVIEEKDCP